MATMVKEKRKNKNKSKEKSSNSSAIREPSPVTTQPPLLEKIVDVAETNISNIKSSNTVIIQDDVNILEVTKDVETDISIETITDTRINSKETCGEQVALETKTDDQENTVNTSKAKDEATESNMSTKEVPLHNIEGSYRELSKKLKRIAIPNEPTETISREREFELLNADAYLNSGDMAQETSFEYVEENVIPSAPCFEEIPESVPYEEVFVNSKRKVKCMPLEDALKIYGGKEMEEVRAMSEREEEIVEAGPMSGAEHPLVDLLSTFRSSLAAVERERIQLACGFADEEKSRGTLWKVEKRHINISEKCKCGLTVDLKASYEHAELVTERLPVAKLRLESLLRDVQDSYCHHQHTALLAHCQIEQLISETTQSNKGVIREYLSLVLQALRLSDNAPEALASALQRWAAALSAALLDNRDLRQLLFLMHHLFRQSRSVQWAAQVVQAHVVCACPWRLLALLELLLARPRTDTALECTEEAEEAWEEVDKHGGGGAVSEGSLRERDLLALLYAFPIGDIVARFVLFTHSDIRQARSHEWGDSSGGGGVVRACCGVRALVHVCARALAAHAHAGYARLHTALIDIAARALHALGCLHLTSRQFYATQLIEKISVELEASFLAGFNLFDGQELDRLPATLLDNNTAKDYCITIIVGLHDKSPKQLDLLSLELPVLSCAMRVRIVSQAAVDRTDDHELARIILEFLLQTGLKRKSVTCKDLCDAAARECVAKVLAAHPYLHTTALHILADLNIVETLDPSCVKTLNVNKWRPNCNEIQALLDDWARRCHQFLPTLLLELDYTPYTGLFLDVQLSIGSWLCSWVRSQAAATAPEWCWSVLRRLRVHRTCWSLPLDAPPPDAEPPDLFSTAYALMSTSLGHCIPVICSEGVLALCKLAAVRPRDAVQCLAGVMLVMAHSPESVALTPKFMELFTTLLNSGPSLMQRALGRGGVPGSELLLRLILTQLADDAVGVSSAGVLRAWLTAAWCSQCGAGAAALLDAAATATRLWPHLDAFANTLLQQENAKDHINQAVRNASVAPLMCECVMRAQHAAGEARAHVLPRLLSALHQQRAAGHKIHVDNALQKIGSTMSSEELVIYRTATAALVAPMKHPSHLTLWRLFMHLYLQTPPDYGPTTPVGPLFFSGLIKSRTLNQIKRRLLETITYHYNAGETLKAKQKSIDTNDPQSTKRETRSSPEVVDDCLLPALSIVDLTGESSAASDTDDNIEDSENRTSPNREPADRKRNISNLIAYHAAAEKMLNEYLSWIEEGENVCAAPHYADIARFIPEQALEAAWKRAVPRLPPSPELDSFPMPVPRPAPDKSPQQTPFHTAVNTILKIKDHSKRRRRSHIIKSPLEDVDFTDSRPLVSLVDRHLKDLERLAQEWCTEMSRVMTLDYRLWELVSALRVRRALSPVRKSCANKCKPITIYIPEQEWCISVDAERSIRENRRSARVALRRLARARPLGARTAAALLTIARRTGSSGVGVQVVERAWRCAGLTACQHCAPATSLLTALVTYLAERWICHDGRICAELISNWSRCGGSMLQQALCGALLAPRRLPAEHWPRIYITLLDSQLPSHIVFSYLSKFEMSRWSETAEASQRRDMLEALIRGVQRWGPAPASKHHMLVELLGLHSSALLDARELCAHIVRCATAALHNTLPPTHWTHVVKAVEMKAVGVPFDQLGHLLRELGVLWWEARTGLKGSGVSAQLSHLSHAPHVAFLLHALQRAFVAAATRLSYEPERVAWYAWSSLQESWGAWVCPHPAAPPLLPSTSGETDHYTPMLAHFVDNLQQVMLDCPGTEVYLLQQIFEWSVQTYITVQAPAGAGAGAGVISQESRVQASALLAELAKLPWTEHQWFYGKCLQQALQMSTSTDRELTAWCCSTWRGTTAATMLKDSDASQLVPRLASLLYLFTGTHLPHSPQMLEEACKLPWSRLPEPALDEALDRYFMLHHNPAQPYHDLPQFRIILVSCELRVCESVVLGAGGTARVKRARAVSQWVRGACAPALIAHVPAHALQLLRTVTDLAPHLEESEGEIEELLSRAVVIMCMEPAAAAALPVWVSWVGSTTPRLVRACVSAVAALTAFEYFATLADAAVRALLMTNESLVWRDIIPRWSSCPWRSGAALARGGRVHAAYACSLTQAHGHEQQDTRDIRDTLAAFLAADLNFVDNEPIIALWICYACRIALAHSEQTESDDIRECGACARALLARWAEQPRRSLLRVVTMQQDTDRPTALHRLLCHYAQCVLSQNANTRRAFEAACTSTLGANNDVSSWSVSPQLGKLVRLAARLWPKYEKYFQYEMDMTPNETVVSV